MRWGCCPAAAAVTEPAAQPTGSRGGTGIATDLRDRGFGTNCSPLVPGVYQGYTRQQPAPPALQPLALPQASRAVVSPHPVAGRSQSQV